MSKEEKESVKEITKDTKTIWNTQGQILKNNDERQKEKRAAYKKAVKKTILT